MRFVIKASVVFALILLIYLFVLSALGRECLGCDYNPALQVNYSNPGQEDIETVWFIAAISCAFPFAGVGLILLAVAGARIAASEQTRKRAMMARIMGEEGVGTRLFLGTKRGWG